MSRDNQEEKLILEFTLAGKLFAEEEEEEEEAVLSLKDITKRKKAEEQILRQSAMLDAINKVFQGALTSDTDAEVGATCLAVAQELTGSKFGFIGELNQAGLFDTIAISNPGWDACKMPDSDATRAIKNMEIRGFDRSILREEQSRIVNDPASHPDRVGTPEGHPKITSFLGVPLKQSGRTIGMIGLANKERGYDLADQEAIEALSVAFVEAFSRRRAEEELAKERNLLRTLIDNLPDCYIFVKDTESQFITTNAAHLQTLGAETQEEVIGKTDFAFFPQELAEQYYADEQTVIQSGRPLLNREELVIDQAGMKKWVLTTKAPLHNGDGSAVGLVGMSRDITELKRAEEALAQAATLWQNTFDAIEDPVVIIDKDFRVVRANQATHKAFAGVKVLGAHCYELLHGTEEPIPHCPSCQVFHSGEATHFELCEHHLGNRWFDVFAYPIKDKDGPVQQLVHVVRDITERKRAESEMLSLLQLHRNTLATIPSQLLILDAKLDIVMANQRFLGTRNPHSSDIIGKNISDVLPDSLLEEHSLLGLIRGVVDTGGQDELLGISYTFNDHQDKHIDIRICGIRPSEEEEKEETRVLLVIDDVTQQRTLEEQLRQAAKMESVGKLAGGVAHDFNNILTGIINYAKFVLDELPADSPMTQDVAQIRELGKRAAALTRQLLAFSRRQTLAPIGLDVNTLVENMSKMLQRLIGEDIDLEFVAAADLGKVKADPGQIEQVLMNLAVNARDAMPDGGRFTIETASVTFDQDNAMKHGGIKPGAYVMLAATDTGCGMDEATQERIFEPFFTTKGIGEGTGLGLSTSYGIIKQHEGHIEVYSAPHNGTTFKVYLPQVDDKAYESAAEDREEHAPRGAEMILVVEDEDAVRVITQRVLEKQGYTVVTASCSNEAEEVFTQFSRGAQHDGRVDLLLTDVVMPGRNGRELYERLAIKHSSLKVLYMSGYTADAIARHGVLAGDIPFIQKPIEPNALGRKVREVLDG